MAKELPYFKFEPAQWESGNIQMCSYEEKGIFLDLCSLYWLRLGDLPYKLAVQKVCGGNAVALDSLYEEKIFDIIDGSIFISFLSEQLEEFEDVSKKNSKNAKEGWEKRRILRDKSDRNATALSTQCESDAIREDKIREDNINNNLTVDWVALLKFFNDVTGRSFKVVSARSKKQIKDRLKEGYSKEDLVTAINNCFNDKYHQDNRHYLTLEFISRSDKMEKFATDCLKPKLKQDRL
jgi:uncharacterized phage protein (TIGR02220 family)